MKVASKWRLPLPETRAKLHIWLFGFEKTKEEEKKETEDKNKKKTEAKETAKAEYIPESWRYISASQFFGWYWFIIIPILSILTFVALFLTTVITIFLVNWLFDTAISLNWLISIGLLFLSIYVNMPDTMKTNLTVPNQHVAVLTLFGERIAWFLKEGDYPDITSGSILGRSTEVVDDFTTQQDSPHGPGFVNMGRLSFQLWNSMKDKTPLLTNVARNGAQVFTTVLIVLQVRNPNLVLSADAPAKEVFERARTAIRTGNAFFTDKDNAFVKTILVKLMVGKTIITDFVNTNKATNYENGSVIRDFGGKALIGEIDEKLLEGKKEEEKKCIIEEEKKEFRKTLEDHADDEMLKYVPRVENGKRVDEGGELVVYDKSVDQSIDEVLHPNGIDLVSASVSNVRFSPEVTRAANDAASEVYQAKKMRDSAIAQGKAEAALHDERNKSGYTPDELDRVIVAAQDSDQVRVVHVSGTSSELTKAAGVLKDGKPESRKDRKDES